MAESNKKKPTQTKHPEQKPTRRTTVRRGGCCG